MKKTVSVLMALMMTIVFLFSGCAFAEGNNGAYFEEGYAMGLGKPVIQLCKKGITLHFDIAQKNTIMWEIESDITERLSNRIKATID